MLPNFVVSFRNREMELEVDQNEIDRQLRVVMEKPGDMFCRAP